MTPAPATCPRCAGRLVRSHDELWCMVHGEVWAPVRAWETAPADGTLEQTRTGRSRTYGARLDTVVPWTDAERRAWETWREGDPVPGDDQERAATRREENAVAQEQQQQFAMQSTAQLGAACIARAQEAAAQIARQEEEIVTLRAEVRRLVAVARLCEVEVPSSLARSPAAPDERWTCGSCGWQAKGRYPGRHSEACARARGPGTGTATRMEVAS